MNGCGPFKLYGGQITDDSELATCMMLGLINNKEEVKQSKMMENYIGNDTGKKKKPVKYSESIVSIMKKERGMAGRNKNNYHIP